MSTRRRAIINKLFEKRHAHRITTRTLGALHPFLWETGFGRVGYLLGRSNDAPFLFSEWDFYPRYLRSPNVFILGHVGQGKSTNLKMRIWRGAAHGVRSIYIDPKLETPPLVDAFNRAAELDGSDEPYASLISLRPGGTIRLNPLEAPPGHDESLRIQLAESIVRVALNRPLQPVEQVGTMRALQESIKDAGDRQPTIRHLAHRLLEPTEDMVREMRATDVDSLRYELRDCGFALQRMITGDLAGMFDEETTPGLSLDHKFVGLDLSAVHGSPAQGLLMNCATTWINNTVALERRSGAPPVNRLMIVDEGWACLSDLPTALWLRQGFKLSRSLGIAFTFATHSLQDLEAAADQGTAIFNIAKSLLTDSGVKIMYYHDPAAIPATQAACQLTDAEAARLATLGVGEALWKIQERTCVVQLDPSRQEWAIIDTDDRMRRTSRGAA